MKTNQLSNIQKTLLVLSGMMLIGALFIPLWRIDLTAPQYPEGLTLLIYPHKLAGNVAIINDLNHYIGMKYLYTKNFIEFTLLPYLIGFFAFLSFLVLFINRKRWLNILFLAFLAFGIIAIVDFHRWEYNYGHHLDPNAAIKIPGMTYDPPLLGYKQLLNFTAYSMPHWGGFLFFGSGVVLLMASLFPYFQKKEKNKISVPKKSLGLAAMLLMLFMLGCSDGPKPIVMGKDNCDYCGMTFVDGHFGAEIITQKGKIYKFDDLHCLAQFRKEKIDIRQIKEVYLVNFDAPHNFIKASDAHLLKSDGLHSPMDGKVAAFQNKNQLQIVENKVHGEQISLQQLYAE